jgi:Polyketide cyclase / dehydrase and lipid transport
VRRLPEISPSTVEVKAAPALERVGDRFEQTVVLAGRRFTSEWEVTNFEPERVLVVEGSVLPGTRYAMTEQLDASGPSTTTMSLTIDYRLPFGPLGRLAAKLGAERRALDEAEQVLAGVGRLAEESAGTPRSAAR